MATIILGARTSSPWFLSFAIALLASMTYVGHVDAEAKGDANSRLIEPGIRVGPVTAHSQEIDLVRLLGRGNVRRENLDVGEGFKRPGTKLFPGTDDEIWLFWQEDAYTIPERVVIADRGQKWRTAEGVGSGVTLETLIRLNGRHFDLHGFGWDYGGTVASWQGGRLRRFGDKLTVRVGPSVDLNGLPESDLDAVIGEKVISSQTPTLKKLNVMVYELIVKF